MAHTVYLHVGLPKSGSTYLQAVFSKNKELLRTEHALLFPGARWASQVNAVREIRSLGDRRQRREVAGSWARLLQEIRQWDGAAVVSMEWLCAADEEEIDRIVTDLQPADVHVLFTVRDLARNVPAFWQETTQNGRVWTWPQFLEAVAGEEPRPAPGRKFWSQQDMRVLLPRWTAAVPASRVHVVTVPQRGADPTELWRRTSKVLGIPGEGGYELEGLGGNESLGLESAELMRRLNERARATGIDGTTYNRVFKRRLAKQILSGRKGEESRVLLPPAYHDWARSQAEEQIAAIVAAGVPVVGDLDDLRPVLQEPSDGPATESAREASPEAVLDAAVDALLKVALADESRRRRHAGRELEEADEPGTVAPRSIPRRAQRLAGRAASRAADRLGRRGPAS